MNILVTGANGQLGNEMQLVARTSRDHYIFTDVCDGYPTLDITDLDAVRQVVAEEKIGCIINCAAWTNVDKAETAGDIVETLNAIAPENLARAMKEVGGLLVHVSTDYVFGADPYNTPCQETQTGTPTGVYGLTKLHGEEKIIATGVDHLIIRTAWLYSSFGHNEGVTSWYDFTQMIARLAGHTACDIQPCHSSEFPSPVKRPAYSVLDKTKIKATFGLTIPYWLDSLEKCINLIKAAQA